MRLKSVSAIFILTCLLSLQSLFGQQPVITSISPIFGPPSSGSIVTITGTNFTPLVGINFGALPPKTIISTSPTEIVAVAPAQPKGTYDITVTTTEGTSAITPADQFTYIPSWVAYVTNSGTIIVPINTLDDSVLLTLKTGTPNGQKIAINPDATLAYATLQSGSVEGVNVTNNTNIFPTIPVGGSPMGIAITPDGTRAYVADGVTNVVPFLIPSGTTLAPIVVGNAPTDIAITPDGTLGYATNFNDATVQPFSIPSDTIILPPIVLGVAGTTTPLAISISPDGTRAYVVNSAPGSVTPINIPADTLGTPISVGNNPSAIAISPDGTTAYVTLNSSPGGVVPIQLPSGIVLPTIPAGPNLIDIAITPDGKSAYVVELSAEATNIIQINLSTQALTLITSFSENQGIAITPDQAPTAAFTVTPQPANSFTIFDASASSSPVGSIASYSWDFGDGTTLVTTSAIADHAYAASGTYTVILTVTNTGGTSTKQVFTGHTMYRNGGPSAKTSQEVAVIVLSAPTGLKVVQKCNVFATQTDRINIITWNAPSSGEQPVEYRIFRDSALTDLVAVIPANGPLRFADHNRMKKTYTYFVVAVDGAGHFSAPASVTISPHKCCSKS